MAIRECSLIAVKDITEEKEEHDCYASMIKFGIHAVCTTKRDTE